MDGSITIIIFLIFILLWASARYGQGFWKWADRVIYYIDNYYKEAFKVQECCFPVTEIMKLTKTKDECDPCALKETTTSSVCPPNVFNFNCGATNTTDVQKCTQIAMPTSCEFNTEAIFMGYKYVLDKLPGNIFKFTIDSNGCVDPASKDTITHSLGRLVRINVSNGNLIVEDIHSIEHIANVNSTTGALTF